ncbi:demethylmenaquinone methyltransferase [Abditibacteriota bacterium]|nr:demethylmenaquinone methyltransferase [Abditibacteriota bacterium]
MLDKIDYDERQHAVYARGRAVNSEAISRWMQAFARHLSPRRPLVGLDLGSGTGRFTPALAKTFGGPIYGVEPALKTRSVAENSAHHPDVTYMPGDAAHIPLPDNSVDFVLMFLSFHHVPERAAAATEIARVLQPSGRLLIRSTFSGRMPDLLWHHFFPRAGTIEMQMFPSVGEVVEVFAPVGLRFLDLEAVRERLASSLAESAARLHLRAISTFEHLSEAELTEGFARLDAAVAAETTPQPIDALSDLLVLGY